MKTGFLTFTLIGLAVAAMATAAAVASGGTGQSAALITAAILAAGDAGAALFAAGEQERKIQAIAWVRCGLIAAALSFVALYVFVVPAALYALAAAASANLTLRSGAIFAASIALGALLVWFSLRLAWRRAAPKANNTP
jgi:Ca2+/H+ antiporter